VDGAGHRSGPAGFWRSPRRRTPLIGRRQASGRSKEMS
jgi:hypothetical protein